MGNLYATKRTCLAGIRKMAEVMLESAVNVVEVKKAGGEGEVVDTV